MIYSYIVYWAGAYLDYITTKRGLKAGLKERNPVARWLMRHTKFDVVATVLKLGAFVLFIWIRMDAWWFYAMGAVQMVAAAYNYKLRRKI